MSCSVILRPQAEESIYCLSAQVRCTDYASSRIVGNANRRDMEPPINDRRYARVL